jgi:hypothetical protein
MIMFEDIENGLVVTVNLMSVYLNITQHVLHKSTRTWTENLGPKNAYEISQAKRACELGLEVPIPEPEYHGEVLDLTEEDVESIIESMYAACWFDDNSSSFVFRDPDLEIEYPDIKFTDTEFSWCSAPGVRTHISILAGVTRQSPTSETLALVPEKIRKQLEVFMMAREAMVNIDREEKKERELQELKRRFGKE